jgi:hypothetical protein
MTTREEQENKRRGLDLSRVEGNFHRHSVKGRGFREKGTEGTFPTLAASANPVLQMAWHLSKIRSVEGLYTKPHLYYA